MRESCRARLDHAIDYTTLENRDGDEERPIWTSGCIIAPDGIDMYYENVGVHFESAMTASHGRVAVCGIISKYNDAQAAHNKIDIGAMIYTFQRSRGLWRPRGCAENAAISFAKCQLGSRRRSSSRMRRSTKVSSSGGGVPEFVREGSPEGGKVVVSCPWTGCTPPPPSPSCAASRLLPRSTFSEADSHNL